MSSDNTTATTEVVDPIDAMIAQFEDGLRLDRVTNDTAFGYAMQLDEKSLRDPRIIRWFHDRSDVSMAELTRAVRERARNDAIIRTIGSVPQNPAELVQLVTKRDSIVCRYDGSMEQNLKPFMITDKGEKLWYHEHPEAMNDLQVRSHARFNFPKRTNLHEFKLTLRVLNDELRLRMRDSAIEDAVDIWYAAAKRERLQSVYENVAYPKRDADVVPNEVVAAAATWAGIVDKVFVETIPGYTEAVLRSFIWQVKRKIYALDVTNHLMPVILGPQGVGKTTFVTRLLEPIRELTIETTFAQVEDERNIEVWDRYVLFLDEMGYANKSDVEAIKHAITAAQLSRRPMRSNGQITVEQRATFIGCSNKELAQLIIDPTGMRRFAPIQFSTYPDWGFMNEVDWRSLWRSVDEHGPNPILGVMAELKAVQDGERHCGRVETWLRDFDPDQAVKADHTPFKSLLNGRGRIAAQDLYDLYRAYEDTNFPGAVKTDRNAWSHEMKRLSKNAFGRMIFEKVREAKGVFYDYTPGEDDVTT